MVSENIKMIEALTYKLPSVPSLSEIASPIETTRFSRFLDVDAGSPIEEWGLFKQKNAAISICQGVAGTLCREHVHEKSKEYYIVIRGRIVLIHRIKNAYGKYKIVNNKAKVGEVVFTPVGVPHRCRFSVDSTFIVITVPADDGMPDSHEFEGIKND